MTWYWRTRGWVAIAIAVLLSAGLTTVTGTRVLAVPGLFGSPLGVPLALMWILVPVVAVAHALAGAPDQLEGCSHRHVRHLDIALAVLVVAAVGVLVVAMDGGTLSETAVTAMRNAAGLMGLALLGGLVGGTSPGALLPVSWVLASSLMGGGPDGRPRAWAWPLATHDNRTALTLAILLFAIGAAAHILLTGRRALPQP